MKISQASILKVFVAYRPVMKNPDGVRAEAALWSDSYLFSGMAANAGMHSSRGRLITQVGRQT